MECSFCNKVCKNANSHNNHERLCKSNPNRQRSWFEDNKYIKTDKDRRNQSLGQTGKKQSEERKQKTRERTLLTHRSDEYRALQSERMKKAVLKYPESYSDNNVVGRSKHITINGIRFNSTWEVMVSEYLDKNDIKWSRKGLKPISYMWNESWHLYFPDFYLDDYDVYVEVKGYETERDKCKWKHCDKPVIIIKQNEIKLIQNDRYNLIEEILGGKHKWL